jgi:hypothetical protein
VVAARGWLIVTLDRHIQSRTAELNAVREHGAKMVNLAGAETTGTWAQLEVLLVRWREIEPLIDQPGPFIYIATRTGKWRMVDLTA